MYKIIGVDGQTYGPVTAEEVRRWIAESRADARTKIQPEGSADWKLLGDLPEFADSLKAAKPGGAPPTIQPLSASAASPTSTSNASANADAIAAEILARGYQLDIGRCFSRGWDLVMKNFWLMVGASFVVGLIESVAGVFLVGPCVGGLYFLSLKLIRGQKAEFADAFAGFSLAFLQLFLAGLVTSLLTGVGLMLCILPGIYLGVAWIFTEALILDKKLDFWPAMEVSRKVVSQHWWGFFLMLLAAFGLSLLGILLCCVGIYVAQPVILAALAYAYEDIFGRSPQNSPRS